MFAAEAFRGLPRWPSVSYRRAQRCPSAVALALSAADPLWRPSSLRRARPDLDNLLTRGSLAYVVVDDLDAGVAELVVSDWPRLDDAGRLVFDQASDANLVVDVASLETFLHERVGVAEVDPTADH